MLALPYAVRSPQREYVLEENVSGGTASYRARSDGTSYFVKVAESPRRAARLLREVAVVQRLGEARAPGIIPVVETFSVASSQFVVFQFVGGENLERWPREQPQSAERLVPIVVDVGRTLDAAHAIGIVHLDLKPGNLHLSDAIYTVDWEAAKNHNTPHVQPSGQYFSTIAYVSPEVALGQDPDARSDVYQLAGTVYSVLTGKKPNVGTPEQIEANILMQQTRRRSLEDRLRLGPAVWHAVTRGLAFKPAERQQSAGEFARDFREAVNGLTQ